MITNNDVKRKIQEVPQSNDTNKPNVSKGSVVCVCVCGGGGVGVGGGAR